MSETPYSAFIRITRVVTAPISEIDLVSLPLVSKHSHKFSIRHHSHSLHMYMKYSKLRMLVKYLQFRNFIVDLIHKWEIVKVLSEDFKREVDYDFCLRDSSILPLEPADGNWLIFYLLPLLDALVFLQQGNEFGRNCFQVWVSWAFLH